MATRSRVPERCHGDNAGVVVTSPVGYLHDVCFVPTRLVVDVLSFI